MSTEISGRAETSNDHRHRPRMGCAVALHILQLQRTSPSRRDDMAHGAMERWSGRGRGRGRGRRRRRRPRLAVEFLKIHGCMWGVRQL